MEAFLVEGMGKKATTGWFQGCGDNMEREKEQNLRKDLKKKTRGRNKCEH